MFGSARNKLSSARNELHKNSRITCIIIAFLQYHLEQLGHFDGLYSILMLFAEFWHILMLFPVVYGFYAGADNIIQANTYNFKKHVFKTEHAVLAEFYAPWWLI